LGDFEVGFGPAVEVRLNAFGLLLVEEAQHLVVEGFGFLVGVEETGLVGGVEVIGDGLLKVTGSLVVEAQQSGLLINLAGEERLQSLGHLLVIDAAAFV
jgi:hypothetical protein